MKLVRIEWLDAQASDVWIDKSDVGPIGGDPCITFGFVVAEDEKWKRIAHTDGGNQYHGVFDIPRACIVSERVIEG